MKLLSFNNELFCVSFFFSKNCKSKFVKASQTNVVIIKNAPVKKTIKNQFQTHNTVKLRTYNTN